MQQRLQGPVAEQTMHVRLFEAVTLHQGLAVLVLGERF